MKKKKSKRTAAEIAADCKRTGRPAEVGKRRTYPFQIRMTAEEVGKIRAEAVKVGLTASSWARRRILEGL